MDPTDVIILTHNRLSHLAKTVDTLLERTPEPIRVTVVDNASGPDVRNWLAENRGRFERVILRPTNEYVSGFQHGIEATTSDPYVVTDPDIVLPRLEPSWLARQLDLMARHPDFGTIAVDGDPSFAPSWVPPETLARIERMRRPIREVDANLVECEYVGTHFQVIRRAALREPYVQDAATSNRIRRAGYRVGFNRSIRAHHLGTEDVEAFPEHFARKVASDRFGSYWALAERLPRPPSLTELARAASILKRTREAGISDASIVELAWEGPALGAAVEGPVTLLEPRAPLKLAADAAGAVVLLEPPAASLDSLLGEAFRVATRLVVVAASLEAFGPRLADDVSPEGWGGHECPWIGDLPLELARAGQALEEAEFSTLEHRERWLDVFAAADFGAARGRLFVFEPESVSVEVPPAIRCDPEELGAWRPERVAAVASKARPRGRKRRPARHLVRRARGVARSARRRLSRG